MDGSLLFRRVFYTCELVYSTPLAPSFYTHLPREGSKVHLNCHVYTAEGKNEATFCLSLHMKKVLFLEIPAIEFFPEILFVHCYLLFHSFRDCIVGKLATAVLTASVRFTLRGV